MKTNMKPLPYEWLLEVINISTLPTVIVDQEGLVYYLNKAYCDILSVNLDDAIGQPVQEIIENSRMHIVAKTGKEELEDIQPINGTVMIANRYPLIIKGELVGAVGTVMFPNPDDLRQYKNKVQQLIEELKHTRTNTIKDLNSNYTFQDLMGSSPVFQSVKQFAEKVSGSDSSVLLTGESGTGKELFAHAIHNSSLRDKYPFIPVNCASIPADLLESELFGYEDGAFTGAKKGGKKGLFEIANHGTVFLDEIGDMPFSMQSKLLRALQEREIKRVGGQNLVHVDVRIIAATNRDLEKMVEDGSFRQDLYYRLNVINIEVPPLRKRKEDIEFITNKLIKKLEGKFYRQGTSISSEVLEKFQQHSWPGNVRELENVLERTLNVLDSQTIQVEHLPLYIRDAGDVERRINKATRSERNSPDKSPIDMSPDSVQPLKETLASAEKEAIKHALSIADGNKLTAAKMLGVGKTSFYEKCKRHGIN
ncbi:sigma-54 interaction domain-containing protein [Texcoconibacillus texcoconensis]|uniref:Transcriptional regulator with PAS, ATPase and Fis domain n=1 Tax=Texcoconibacillus texcoconensis TaxID=1095777 RepID=A0A840QP60_9BACI|nr:sigma 54-interacting transcriptional regulator [Texcoconibacillus texcoconensis]MBB5173164.1 transcriptional regulator with PAS, ATPase and Fis domain [Texcoconibacillus texcoconensis]